MNKTKYAYRISYKRFKLFLGKEVMDGYLIAEDDLELHADRLKAALKRKEITSFSIEAIKE